MKTTKTRPEIIREFYVLALDPQGIRYSEMAEVWFDQAAARYLDEGVTEFSVTRSAVVLDEMVRLFRAHELHDAAMRGQLPPSPKSWLQRLWNFLTAPTLSTGPR